MPVTLDSKPVVYYFAIAEVAADYREAGMDHGRMFYETAFAPPLQSGSDRSSTLQLPGPCGNSAAE
jgi:hypothetical protein